MKTFVNKKIRLGAVLISAVTFTVLFAALIFSFLVFISCEQQAAPSPKISSFSFKTADNSEVSALQSTVSGDIDDEKKTIRVFLPESLYSDSAQRKLLKPSVEVQDGNILASGEDYSRNPVSVSVGNENESVTYLVNIEKASSALPANALMFTEYYSEGAAPYKNKNNQYIEITNMTSETLDLSQVLLTKHAWKDGTRREDLDQSVYLSGTLQANAILVIYSKRCSLTFSNSNNGTTRVFQSDIMYNSIITFSGQDGLTLSCNGKILDVLGPDEGKGTGWNWGVAKKMQRKNYVKAYSLWREDEWITEKISSSSNNTTAGRNTDEPSASNASISYFALEGMEHIAYGDINDTDKTIQIKLADNVSPVQEITVSTYAQAVRYNNRNIISGETKIDFSKDNISIEVIDGNGDSQNYTVTCTFVHYNYDSAPSGDYYRMNEKPKDGDVVLLFNPANNAVVGKNVPRAGRLEVVAESDSGGLISYSPDMASLCVTVDSDGLYTFTNNGKYLAVIVANDSSSLVFDTSASDSSLFKVEETPSGSGLYTISCPNALVGNSGQYLEFYSNAFNAYGYRASNQSLYQFQFYKKTN